MADPPKRTVSEREDDSGDGEPAAKRARQEGGAEIAMESHPTGAGSATVPGTVTERDSSLHPMSDATPEPPREDPMWGAAFVATATKEGVTADFAAFLEAQRVLDHRCHLDGPQVALAYDCPHVAADRRALDRKIRGKLDAWCKGNGLAKGAPKMAYDRWAFVQKVLEGRAERDPVIPHGARFSLDLFKELVEAGVPASEAKGITSGIAKMAKDGSETIAKRPRCPVGACKHGSVTAAHDRERGGWFLRWRRKEYFILDEHYAKVKSGYEAAGSEDDLFPYRLYVLLARYEALGASSYQAALPARLFAFLSETMGVGHECFASPLNRTLDRFCSAYPDVDAHFGSSGDFFDPNHFQPSEGSFEANPPFVEETMHAMVERIEDLLGAATGPLSFVVFVPGWVDATSYVAMLNSPYLREHVSVPRRRHRYKVGDQHQRSAQHWEASFDTGVFVLQNDLGNATWPPPPDFSETLTTAFTAPPAKPGGSRGRGGDVRSILGGAGNGGDGLLGPGGSRGGGGRDATDAGERLVKVLAAQEQKRTTIGDRRSGARLMERFEVLVEGEPAVKQLRVVSPERAPFSAILGARSGAVGKWFRLRLSRTLAPPHFLYTDLKRVDLLKLREFRASNIKPTDVFPYPLELRGYVWVRDAAGTFALIESVNSQAGKDASFVIMEEFHWRTVVRCTEVVSSLNARELEALRDGTFGDVDDHGIQTWPMLAKAFERDGGRNRVWKVLAEGAKAELRRRGDAATTPQARLGYVGPPGGGLEDGDASVFAAGLREFREEVGGHEDGAQFAVAARQRVAVGADPETFYVHFLVDMTGRVFDRAVTRHEGCDCNTRRLHYFSMDDIGNSETRDGFLAGMGVSAEHRRVLFSMLDGGESDPATTATT